MKICIPTETGDGRAAVIAGHFGSATFYALVDTENGLVEVVDNSDREHLHGQCVPIRALTGKNVEAVLCRGMGLRAIQRLQEAGIRVLRTEAETVAAVLQEIERGGVVEMTAEQACRHHKNCG